MMHIYSNSYLLPVFVPKRFVFAVVFCCPNGVVCCAGCCGCPNKLVPDVVPKLKPAGLFAWPNAEVPGLVPKRFVDAFCWVPKRLVLVFVVPKPMIKVKINLLNSFTVCCEN